MQKLSTTNGLQARAAIRLPASCPHIYALIYRLNAISSFLMLNTFQFQHKQTHFRGEGAESMTLTHNISNQCGRLRSVLPALFSHIVTDLKILNSWHSCGLNFIHLLLTLLNHTSIVEFHRRIPPNRSLLWPCSMKNNNISVLLMWCRPVI